MSIIVLFHIDVLESEGLTNYITDAVLENASYDECGLVTSSPGVQDLGDIYVYGLAAPLDVSSALVSCQPLQRWYLDCDLVY
jgi:hypothetical protein